MPQPRLDVPRDRAVYTQLLTDHYPWTEVTLDLAARQAQGLSGVFDAQQGGAWARFVWVGGHLRGGFTAAGEVSWPAALAALPRAEISLTPLDPAAAELLWSSRMLAPQPLEGVWPDPASRLERQGFTGVLLGGGACSFWSGGRVAEGPLPEPGTPCTLLSAQPLLSDQALGAVEAAATLAFWADLIATAHRHTPLDEAWRQVSVRLAGQHPCLDPFAQEVTVQEGRLTLDPDLPAAEAQPALRDAFGATLARLGLRLADLPVGRLHTRREWLAAGLERPEVGAV